MIRRILLLTLAAVVGAVAGWLGVLLWVDAHLEERGGG